MKDLSSKQAYNKSKFVCLLLIFTLLAVSLMGCTDKSFKDGSDVTFTVGFDAEFPPYGYKDESGEYVGFDLDLAQEVCDRQGWTLEKKPIDWDFKDMELESGTIDCIWNGFTIDGRESEYTWTTAYVDNSQVVITKKASGITKLSDLEGKTVIVQADSSALAAFTGEDATAENVELCSKFKKLEQVGDYNTAFMNLESGMADAVCLDMGVANYQIKQRGDEFVMLDERVSSEQYGVGFYLGNTGLRDQVQETLNEMLADGTFAEIAEEWELSDCVCLGKEGTDKAYSQDAPIKDTENIASKIVSIVKQLGGGILASLAIFALTLVLSLPLGLLLMFVRKSKFFLFRWIARVYISIMRGTPLMLQLIVVFYAPYYLLHISTNSSYRFISVIIAFSLNYAAYFAEIFRSGVESIPDGQREAANVLGYTRFATFWKIIFPQMAKRVIPPVTNEVITLVKDTSLAFAITFTEMFTVARQIAATDSNIIPLFVAGLFYFIFNFVVAMVMERIEKKMQYYK